MSALVICTGGGIGDLLLATPVMRALRGRFGEVVALTSPAHRDVLANDPELSAVWADDLGFGAQARRIAAAKFDAAIVTWATPRSAALPLAARIPIRVGQARRLYSLAFTQRVLVRMPNAPSPQRRYPRWVSFVLALVPLSAALAAFWWQRKRDRERKAFLEQWETHLDFEPIRVHTRSEEEDLFQAAEVATLARELRRRRPEPTSQLAVESTVCKTVERGGIFTPVRRQRQGSREYLVLLES